MAGGWNPEESRHCCAGSKNSRLGIPVVQTMLRTIRTAPAKIQTPNVQSKFKTRKSEVRNCTPSVACDVREEVALPALRLAHDLHEPALQLLVRERHLGQPQLVRDAAVEPGMVVVVRQAGVACRVFCSRIASATPA